MSKKTAKVILTGFFLMTIVNCGTSHHSQYESGDQLWENFSRQPSSVEQDDDWTPAVTDQIKGTIAIPEVDEAQTTSTKAKACGHLLYGETAHTALNPDEVFYALHVDCKSVGADTKAQHFIKIDRPSIQSQQLSYLTRWRRQAVDNKKSRRGVPYICLVGELTGPVCSQKNSIVQAKKIEHFTSKPDVFVKW